MRFGAILAGGIGSRMKIADIPKQFLPLGNKPVIIHTLEKFIVCTKIDKIYIGVQQNWISYMNDLIEKHIENRENIHIVEGGRNRNDTIFNIINGIEIDYGKNDEHIIITHDAVRPFLTLRILNENIEATEKHGACNTVVNSTDTIIKSTNGVSISEIPLREHMYQGQTPQSFNITKLKGLYSTFSDEEKSKLTDACNILVKRNEYVHLVKGEVSNIKITTANDYKVVQAMIGGLSSD